MKRYYKEEDGTKIWFSGVLKYDGRQIINPSEEQLINAGYVEFIPPAPVEPTEAELLERAKANKIKELYQYDESDSVNTCYIVYGGQTVMYWADKHERDALKSAVRDYIALGKTEYRLDLREMGISITLPCELLLQMLAALEVYATECYNKTTDHEFAIKALTTKDEMEAYNFTVGYPEKLVFNLDGEETEEEVKDVTKGEIIEEEVENGLD